MIVVKAAFVGIVAGATELAASVSFANTITTGAIISSLIVVVVAGLFTIRANAARTWHDNYDAEKTSREACEERERLLRVEMAREREDQQALRHELKNEVAALRLKTDLTEHEAQETQRHAEIMTGFTSVNASLQQVAAALTKMNNAR